jgi:integrase/recombinase XerD
MTPQLRGLLTEYARERCSRGVSCDAYIASASGDRQIGEVTIRRIFKVASRAVGMRVTPHMLRHTFATLLRQAGVPDRVAMDLLGHRSLEMLQRYSHVESGEHLKEAARLHLDVELGM